MNRIVMEPELLESLYYGNDYGLQRIGDIFSCGVATVRRRMIEYGFSCGVTEFIFNNRQKEIFEGLMLGDGSLRWATNYCSFSNDDVHKEYLIWLQRLLGVRDISRITPLYYFCGAGAPYAYSLRTRVIPSIRDEHKRWYPYGTIRGTTQNMQHKIIPKDIELTPIKLLFWYIGDGTYNKDRETVRFTNHLILEDWKLLSEQMCKLLDTDCGVSMNKSHRNSNGKQIYLLRLNKIVTSMFFDLVEGLDFDIPNCYQYKFGR